MRSCTVQLFGLFAAGCLIAGCSPPNAGDTTGAPTGNASSTAPDGVDFEDATQWRRVVNDHALADYLPPLDDGRVELAPPADWRPLPRSDQYVVRFVKSPARPMPRIVVTREEFECEPTESPETAILELRRELLDSDRQWTYEPEPFWMGRRACLVYSTKAVSSGAPVEIIGVETLLDGRRYRFELQSYPEFQDPSRPALYAAVAGLRSAENADD